MLRNLTFVVQFAYFSIRPKQFLFFRATFEQLLLIQKATFDCFFEQLSSNFLMSYGNFFENLEQLVESPSGRCGEVLLYRYKQY